VTRDIVDAVGEITNMVSGVSRTQMEKMGMSVYAAIPTVVRGRNHRIAHILRSPGIVVPFSIPSGDFFIDVCIKTMEEKERSSVHYRVVNSQTLADSGSRSIPAAPGPAPAKPWDAATRMQGDAPPVSTRPDETQGGQRELGKPITIEAAKEGAAGKLDILRAKLKETISARDSVLNELSDKPFY
jgi:hypothetical protein